MRRDEGHEGNGKDVQELEERWARLREAEACWETRRQQLDCRLAELAAARVRVEAAQAEYGEARQCLDRLEARLQATRSALDERERLVAEREAAVERRVAWVTAREQEATRREHAAALGLGVTASAA